MRHPLSLDALIDWLSRQPADGEYDWHDCHNCLGFQWLGALGLPIHQFGFNHWYPDRAMVGKRLSFAFMPIASPLPWTYGAALERAKAMRDAAND